MDDWQQGDLIFSPLELPYIAYDNDEVVVGFIDAPHGIALVTQTCDIIRSKTDRPDVHVAALVQVDADELARIERGDKPSWATLPALKMRGLAIDLDAVASVSKDVLANWERCPGCTDDASIRTFASQLARHRQRYAFPDKFNDDVLRPMRRWVESKRKKQNAHGEFIRSTIEFRVWCDDWKTPTDLVLLVILFNTPDHEAFDSMIESADAMLGKCKFERYPKPSIRFVTMDEISAREYVESHRLDWDALSDV